MSNNSKNDETKKYNSSEVNKKTKKDSKKNKKEKSKVGKVIKILIIVLLVTIIIASGVVVGVIWGMFGDELKIEKSELVIPYENSTVYDKDGTLIATLSGGTKRKCISLSEMGKYLPKAYVAIEDERFYEHKGVDIKRTAAATVTYITHGGESSFGGSSITQQLVKNITNDREDSALAGVIRKVKEMSKAMQVEQYLSKDQILELYLNLIFIGGNDINGVELGAIYYFNKQPKDLSIAECAYMAGINHSPNAYKPFAEDVDGTKKEKINKRTKTVLGKMQELGYISKEEYDIAIAEVDNGLNFQNGETSPTIEVSYVVEAALDQLLDKLMEEKNMSQSMAETYLYSGGLKIYTTQDTAVQSTLEEVIKQDKYCTVGKSKDKEGKTIKQNSIPSMVIMDHKTGSVVAAATATGEKGARIATTKIGYLNFPTRLRKSTGSAMKPIAVIAPGLETETITASTVYNDTKTSFDNGKYKPKNYYQGFKGLMTLRQAIEISANIPHVKALANIGTEGAIAFCQSVGLPLSGNEGLSLALGGLGKGVTMSEMAGAYGAIANDGTYIEPIFYKRVTDKDDNLIIEAKQDMNEVLSVQNAYITKSILKEPVVGPSGTAKYCAIKGMDVGAKTGTTNDDFDRWLCGFTPYYTAVCWYGYETNASVSYSGNPAGKIWDEVMTKIHENLPNAEFIKPEGIKEVTVCKSSGLKAKEGCTNTYTEVFTEDTVPEVCEGHEMLMTCTQTNLLCCQGCPYGEWRYYGTPPKERDVTEWTSTGDVANATGGAPTEQCPHFSGVDPEWLARQKQAEAEAAALQARIDAENALKQQQQTTTSLAPDNSTVAPSPTVPTTPNTAQPTTPEPMPSDPTTSTTPPAQTPTEPTTPPVETIPPSVDGTAPQSNE